MPNKTIYVSDKDLPLYERAQAVAGGNLSAAISQALTRYVETSEAADNGMTEVSVQVGQAGMRRTKRFVGVPIARWQGKSGSLRSSIYERYAAYRTARGRFAVHVRRDWSPIPIPFDSDYDVDVPGLSRNSGTSRVYSLDVYDTVDELRAAELPKELVELVTAAGSAPDVEDLDI
jgi:EXLDI family protein